MATQRNDRLAPPLMYAFRAAHRERDAGVPIDIREGGERVIASRRAIARAPIAESELRKLVNFDLLSLMNTTNLDSAEDLSTAPQVRKSVLNYGFPDLASRSIDQRTVSDISREIETTLTAFEPRLARGSIKVRRDDSIAAEELRVRFIVSAELRVQPVNVPIEFAAEVEIDSGKVRIERL